MISMIEKHITFSENVFVSMIEKHITFSENIFVSMIEKHITFSAYDKLYFYDERRAYNLLYIEYSGFLR